MTEAQIKHMKEQFLRWKLPADFHPDNYISFVPAEHQKTGPNAKVHWPVGTNLLTATQAEAMVRHMLDGLPSYAHTEDNCPSHVASADNAKICARCGLHIDSLR
jgi:hypothetical protein